MTNVSYLARQRLKEFHQLAESLSNDLLWCGAIESAAAVCVEALSNDGAVLFCGNGGSAADAQHLAAELSGRFLFDRPPLSGEALHCNTSSLTAIGNDYGYDKVFSRQVRARGRAGDVLVGISTSGNSENIIQAFAAAKDVGIKTIAFTGQGGGRMGGIADILLAVPSSSTPRIQELHIFSGHTLCEIIEREMFSLWGQ